VSLLAGSAGACLTRRGKLFRFRFCGSVAVGGARAEGTAFSPMSKKSGVWAAFSPGLDARWAITERFGLTGNAEVYVPFVRPRIEVVGHPDDTRRFPLAGAAFGAGPSVLFW